MRILLIIMLFLVGCKSSDNYENCKGADLENCLIVNEDNLRRFSEQCTKLAACIGGTSEIVHFSNQKHNPYACSITKKGKTRDKNIYFYPKAEITFGQVTSQGLGNEIYACEMVTETGWFSDASYEEMDRSIKQWRKEQEERNKPAKPLPPIKVRERI